MDDVQLGTSSSSPSSSSNKDQEIHNLQKFLKEENKVIKQMSDDSKSLQQALETVETLKSKTKESDNIAELRRKMEEQCRLNEELVLTMRRKLEEERRLNEELELTMRRKLEEERRVNEELTDTVQRLQKELQLQDVSARRSQEDSDIKDMVQQVLHLAVRLDKQVMQVIKNVEVVDGIVTEDQKTNDRIHKDNELLIRRLKDLAITRDVMGRQIAEHEDHILQMKVDLGEEKMRVFILDKQLEAERNVIKEHRRLANKAYEFLQKTALKARLEASLEKFDVEKLLNDLALMNMDEVENASRNLPNFAATVQNESNRMSENLEESREHNAELRENIGKRRSKKLPKLESKMSKYKKKFEQKIQKVKSPSTKTRATRVKAKKARKLIKRQLQQGELSEDESEVESPNQTV